MTPLEIPYVCGWCGDSMDIPAGYDTERRPICEGCRDRYEAEVRSEIGEQREEP